MLMHVRLETICFLITKAKEFQAKEEVVLPDTPSSPSDDWALQILADHSDDYCFREVQGALSDMNGRQRSELVALMWLGRGDYEVEDWETAVDDALGDHSIRAAEYLLAHPMVSDHLEEGLIALGYSCED